MGIKILNPWWFRLLRNHFSCLHRHLHHHHHHHEPPRTIKVINCDGVVKIYDRPVHVSELLIEFPKHMICRSDSFYIGQKIPPLSMDDKLHFGHDYFLLPQQAFQSALSFVTIASFANARYSSSRESGNAMLKKAAACQPFHIEKSASGCLRLRVSDEFIRQLMEESNVKEGSGDEGCSRICTTPQLQKQYASLVGSRHWKPALETIKEKKKKRRRISFGMKRKNKSLLKNNLKSHRSSSQQHHGDVITCAKPQSKSYYHTVLKSLTNMAGEYPRSVLIALVIFSLVVSPMLPCVTARPPVVCPACVCCGPPPPGGACCSCGCASVQSPPSEMATP